ncbi:hypothetical protein ASA1KI_02030 [Opitutales bacterium ASA1]|nr:hypothetical protein ASA1KI_02030 [Opitutales bacterium ASA1]
MSRLCALFVLLSLFLGTRGHAQGPSGSLWPSEVIGESRGGFALSVRLLGDAKVTFRDLGTIASSLDSGDRFGELTRQYHDGVVQRDARVTTDGFDLPNDGYTNTWTMLGAGQVLPDGSGIAFHNYSTRSDGATVDAESGNEPGFDMELSWRFGGFGARMADHRRRGSWGAFAGLGLTDINAKANATINASLVAIRDVYSLDGARPPTGPYTGPSTETITVIGADGTETSVVVDTTILLGNEPFSRTETVQVGGAELEGFWQVRGSYFATRAGMWARWRVAPQLSVRASAGVSFKFLGLDMRYDEWMDSEALRAEIRDAGQAETTKYDSIGLFGSVDVEFWLTRRTGFFASFTYEALEDDLALTVGGRTADIQLSSGTGFRVGLTTLF